MFNIFKKTDSQQITLGLEIFSKSEYDDFMKLVKSDLESRGYVGDIKDGFLTTKLDGKDESFELVDLAQKCKLVKKSDWPQTIKEYFDVLARYKNDEADLQKNLTDFNKIKNLIAIQLYPDGYLNAASKLKKEVITRNSIPGVNNTLVLDLPSSIRPVKSSEAKVWNKTEDELFALAFNNTFNEIKPEISEQQVPGGKITFITSDNFLTRVLVLNLKKFGQCIGTHGSLVSIPTDSTVMCYPINDLAVVKVMPIYASFVFKLNAEGPGSLSPKLFWFQDDKFTDLHYKLENGKPIFSLPQNFLDMLNKLEEPKN